MAELIDCSYTKPAAAAVKASGYVGVIGYLSQDPAKDLTAGYVSELHGAGLGVLAVWETTADRALSGADGGTADAIAAFGQADALGYPLTVPIMFNLGDFAATPAQIAAIADYYSAVEVVAVTNGRPVGGYATAFIIDQLVARGKIGTWWQNAMNDAGEVGDVVTPNAHLYQRVQPTLPPIPGGGYDEDVEVNGKTVALWTATEPVPAPPLPAPEPAPAPPPPEPAPQPTGGFMVPTLKQGEVSGAVRSAQALLNLHHPLAVDGVFGPATEQAVKNFQTIFHLAVDGIVGPQTWSALCTFG